MSFLEPPNQHGTSSSFQQRVEIKTRIESLLRIDGVVDWGSIQSLLHQLAPSTAANATSSEDDPMGRLILGKFIARQPPLDSLQTFLKAFPDSALHNPAAYFIACRTKASMEVISEMMRHTIKRNNTNRECPYPWILSDLITFEAAQAILQVYPQGVLQPSSLLSNIGPLDFFLRSTEMIETRVFDRALWSKFKGMLIAAQYDGNDPESCKTITPINTLLKRIMSYSDFFDNIQVARHTLWLLHQLSLTDPWVFGKCDESGLYPLHFVLGQKLGTTQQPGIAVAREMIKILLQAHPQSARYKHYGRFSIHMAVENRWPCHDLLLALFPEALELPDCTKMLPFHTAVISSCKLEAPNVISSVDVAFELLRANPTQIRSTQI